MFSSSSAGSATDTPSSIGSGGLAGGRLRSQTRPGLPPPPVLLLSRALWPPTPTPGLRPK
eukprot:9186424-Alexandrium_andersonii.AAC.1